MRKRLLPIVLFIAIAVMSAVPGGMAASAADPYLPPGGADWNKLRDITINGFGWGFGSQTISETYLNQQAFRISTTEWWASQFTVNGWQTIDFSPYYENGTLEFDVVGQAGGEGFVIGFQDVVHERMVDGQFYKDQDSNPEETRQDALSANINTYVPVTQTWTHVSIPLKTIFDSNQLFDKKQVQLLKLSAVDGEPITFWISNMKIVSPDKEVSAAPIKVNQVGYPLGGEKYALVSGYYNELSADVGTAFEVRRQSDNSIAHSGTLSLVEAYDSLSGEKVFKADFTVLNEEGDFYVTVSGVAAPSVPFTIGNGIYAGLLKDVQKFFYYQRANVDLEAAHAGEFERIGAHKQDNNLPLQSNPSVTKDVSGGWWDAGDTGKYVTAGATAVSDLLWAYEFYPDRFTDGQLNIPESGNGIPDLLDEIKFETDFLLKMQHANGGFYSYVNRDPAPNRFIMDGDGTQIPTVMTANTAGILAHASVVFRSVPELQPYAEVLLESAKKGWTYLAANPQVIEQPSGPYNDNVDQNDRFYAAAALYRATGEAQYGDYVKANYTAFETIFSNETFSHGINGMEMIGFYHYLSASAPDAAVKSWFTTKFTNWKNKVIETTMGAVWGNSTNEGFYWGANSNVASVPMSLAIGSRLTDQYDAQTVKKLAQSNLNYLLGINPLQLSYITGEGEHRIHKTHHTIYMSDFIVETPPGYMVGGPNNWRAKFPAKAYNESTVDWETNEQALNYNSPLIFLTAILSDQAVTGVSLDKSEVALTAGTSTKLAASVTPANADNRAVSWSSDNEAVATVDANGDVKAAAPGTARITATAVEGGQTAAAVVTVTAAAVNKGTIKIDASADNSGTVNVKVNTATLKSAIRSAAGQTVTVKVKTADNAGKVNLLLPVQPIVTARDIEVRNIKLDIGAAAVTVNSKILSNNKMKAADTMQLSIAKVDASAIPAGIAGSSAYDFNMSVDGKQLSAVKSSDVRGEIAYTLKPEDKPSKVAVWEIDDAGNIEAVSSSKYNDATGRVEFKPDGFGTFAAGYRGYAQDE
ncbi:glycoside hydrolase family 9 protein [Paenibacillus sp. IB182493]|uniref:Glycoside hydrolase family 9 protein n=2 Tax=Paenibacillus arenilitoris TaxID=2772299 RepID=A0A927H676_9BACL|nr:glycoside hydrolase family 9 protein [Paenibacillus arenilitoris]